MLVEQVGGDELDPVDEVRNPFVRRGGASTDDAEDAVALLEQQLGEVGAILSGDPGDQRCAHVAG